jgi:hypothetical protein
MLTKLTIVWGPHIVQLPTMDSCGMFTNDGIVVVIHGYTGTIVIQLVGNYEGNYETP